MDEINLSALYFQAILEISQLRELLESIQCDTEHVEGSITIYDLYRANFDLAEEVVKLRQQLAYSKMKMTPKAIFKCDCPCYYQHHSTCANNRTLC